MDELELLRRRYERERSARKAAESFAEAKTREQYETNQALQRLAATLQEQVDERTTELRRIADEALVANRSKSLFLSNVSHELRTPLNAILGYGELLVEELEERGEPELGAIAGRIAQAAHHLHALVNDLLDLQKIEAGKLLLSFSEVDVEALVAEVGDMVGPKLRDHRDVLRTLVEPDARRLRTDSLRLRQILFNLLSNAAKFTQDGEVTLRVRAAAQGGSVGLVFEVADTGAGMSAEQLARLFAPYVQVDVVLARRHGGTGLGLALTRRLCQLLGGEISVESEAGRGSCFRVYLPAAPEGA
jgi:signal transduction histidine kinase